MDSESTEMFIRLNEQNHTRGIWGAACVTRCQKESRLGMMAAMNLCIKSWSESMADHLGESFSLHSKCMSVGHASLIVPCLFILTVTKRYTSARNTYDIHYHNKLLYPIIQNKYGTVLFLC